MKRRNTFLLFIFLMVQALFNACIRDSKDERQTLSLFNITLSSSFNDDGTMSYNPWDSRTRCLFFPAGVPSSEMSAPPLVSGTSVADFRLMIPSEIASGDFVLAYPHDAGWGYDGSLHYVLPCEQTGQMETMMAGYVKSGSPSQSRQAVLESVYGVVTFVQDAESVKSIEVSATGGEKISGEIKADVEQGSFTASESFVKIVYQTPREFSGEPVAFMLAPVSLSKGLTVRVEYSSGERQEFGYPDVAEISRGEVLSVSTSGKVDKKQTELVICGDNMVYMIRPDEGDDFEESVFWSLDVKTLSPVLQVETSRCDHVDECKVVDSGSKLLATSSYGFAFLMEIATKKVLWCANNCPNAHSAELLPGNRVAVATSTGTTAYHNKILVYDLDKSFTEIYKCQLMGGHGLVWDDARQRLYAGGLHETKDGFGAIYTYSLNDWDSAVPSLKLERASYTAKYSTSIHDLQYVDSNRLIAGCRSAWFYNVNTGSFAEIPHFSSYMKIKSLNYNASSGQCWYTSADNRNPAPVKETSTRVLCYTEDINSSTIHRKVEIPQDVYKVRVINY